MCVNACMHARMCVYACMRACVCIMLYVHAVQVHVHVWRCRSGIQTENKFSNLTGQTADHSVEAMSFQNWCECFTTS